MFFCGETWTKLCYAVRLDLFERLENFKPVLTTHPPRGVRIYHCYISKRPLRAMTDSTREHTPFSIHPKWRLEAK